MANHRPRSSDSSASYSTSRPLSQHPHRAPDLAYGHDAARENPRLSARRKRRRPQGRSRVGTLVGVFAVLVLGCVGAYLGYLYRESGAVRRYGHALLANATVADQFPNTSAINLMIIGRDYDYNDRDQVIKTHARSDMLMIARIDFAAKTAHILSIPRDTAADIPGHGVDKINAAHAFGGPSLTGATLIQNFAIKPDHYVALDFQGFQEAIDKLGGIDCNIDKKMDYDDNWGHLHIHLTPGLQHLDGEQAMGFVRFRHSDSDLIRTRRQQELLSRLKDKLVAPQTLVLLPVLLDTVDKHVDSDLTDDQKVALARFLHDLPKSSVEMVTLPSIEGGRLVETDRDKAAPIVKSWFGVDMPDSVSAAPHHRSRIARRHRLRGDSPLENVT